MNEHVVHPEPITRLTYFCALGVLLGAIRGETTVDDDTLLDLLTAEPDSGAKKRMAIGLKTHRLISDEQAEGAIAFFKLREA